MQNGYNVNAVARNRRLSNTTELSPELKMKKVFLVGLNFQIWTGSTVLRKEDFKLGENGELPPEDVVDSLGAKKLLDTTTLNGFHAIRARARRFLSENGVRFMGGFAVPVERQSEVLKTLDKCVEEFNEEKKTFLANYPGYVESWIQSHPELGTQLRADAKDVQAVEERLYADYGTMQMQPLAGDEERFGQKVDELTSTLMKDIAATANEFFRKTLLGKEKCRTWQPLLQMRRKLDSLRFLDGGICPVIEMIDAVRAHLPKEGAVVEGSAFVELSACVGILSREETIRAVAEGTVSVDVMTEQITAARPLPPPLPADIPPASRPAAAVPDEESLFDSLFGAESKAPEAVDIPPAVPSRPLPPKTPVSVPVPEGETDDFERLFALAEERMEAGLVVAEMPAEVPAEPQLTPEPEPAEPERAKPVEVKAEASAEGKVDQADRESEVEEKVQEPEFPVHQVVDHVVPELGDCALL